MVTHMKLRRSQGFALPTVIITSIILFAVLVAAVSTVASSATSLNTQYYEGLAADAAESGINMAESCLRQSGYRPTWSDAHPLTPATNCSGAIVSGQDARLIHTSLIQSTFSVPAPTVSSTGSVVTNVTGRVDLIRASTGALWQSYTHTTSALSRYRDMPQIAGGAGWKDDGHNGYMLATNGTLYGWGDNTGQQLGDSSLGTTISTPIVIQLPTGATRTKKVFNSGEGASILCIIAATVSAGDQAYCRGQGGLGGSTWQRFGLPGSLTAIDMVVQGYGTDSGCVLASDQQAYCAGINDSGGLGNATSSGAFVPMSAPTKFRLDLANPGPVSGSAASLTVKRVFTQDRTTCVIASDNQAYCAGDNQFGQLGHGDMNTNLWIGTSIPGRALIPGNPAVVDIRMSYHGGEEGVFFQSQSGDMYMSGDNGLGTANDGSTTGSCSNGPVNCYPTPRQLTTGAFGKLISVGERADNRHGVCIIATSPPGNSGLWCMGSNALGQLGGSGCTDRAGWVSPINVTNGSGAMQVVSPALNVEADYQMNSLTVITTAGDAYSAGDNTYGKLGTGGALTSCNSTFKRVLLPAGVHAVAVANGDEYTMYILGDDGNVYAMGRNNNGQLGNGTTNDSNVPVVVILPRQQLLY